MPVHANVLECRGIQVDAVDTKLWVAKLEKISRYAVTLQNQCVLLAMPQDLVMRSIADENRV